jgi:histidine triad (HIT) family protein
MDDCIFCKIIRNEIPSVKVYEDEDVLAFLDITPVNKGHTLVIPKTHIENIYGFPDEILSSVMKVVRDLSVSVKEATQADGINVIINNEGAAGQIVFHAHYHIIPRFAEDGLRHWKGTTYNPGEQEEMGERIRKVIA